MGRARTSEEFIANMQAVHMGPPVLDVEAVLRKADAKRNRRDALRLLDRSQAGTLERNVSMALVHLIDMLVDSARADKTAASYLAALPAGTEELTR